jgi:hypothetical protein
MEHKSSRQSNGVQVPIDAVSKMFPFTWDVTMKYTQYDAQRKVEVLSTDYKTRQSFMNEPKQEFRNIVSYVAPSNLQRCTVQPPNCIRLITNTRTTHCTKNVQSVRFPVIKTT